ncbi:MAG TPA: metalloregulator ArsR/SmtB family transcription factor, partial [Gaiellales bacterium]
MSFESRRLTDARVMRAMAHPTRMDLMELVAREGELTATEAAERLGLTPANCSFHLRQLAKHGFVEEGEPRTGRSRPWRIGSFRHSWDETGADAETDAAAQTLTSVVLDRDVSRLHAWIAGRHDVDPAWRQAAFLTESLMYLTQEELRTLGEAITEQVLAYSDRIDPDRRPDGAVPVQ